MATRKRAARTRTNGRLEEALTNLINNQALFLGHMARADERFARMDERFARMDERFARMDERFAVIDERLARIESELAQLKTILLHHQRMLEALPEVIREKIGFLKSG